jgi:hypothetical protein
MYHISTEFENGFTLVLANIILMDELRASKAQPGVWADKLLSVGRQWLVISHFPSER